MIQVTIPPGVSSATVHGLHQWDYGRQLQISAEGLPSLFEVHFECPGMKEAEVRLTETVDGVPTVRIPDRCLKQPAPIKAWVYLTDETSGRTELEVTLVVTPRMPPPDTSTPEQDDEAGNKYDQLFALVSEAHDAIEACKNVEVNADEAQAAAESSAASADSAERSASEAALSASAAAASATAAKASEKVVENVSATLKNCFNKTSALIRVENDSDADERPGRFHISHIQGGRSFFYAFFINPSTGKTTSLGVFVWNGTDTVEIESPLGAYGLRVSCVDKDETSVQCFAWLLFTDIYGNTHELLPDKNEYELYIQRLTV